MDDQPVAVDTGPRENRRTRSRRGQGDRLRAEIVGAASRMLAETGEVTELSLRSVARAVGVATTSIYLHFENLDQLVLAVKLRFFEEFGAVLDAAAVDAGPDPVARAKARAHAYVRYGMREHGRYWVMFSSATVPQHVLPPGLLPVGVDLLDAVRDDIAAAVGCDTDTALMIAIHFWTSLHGTVTLRRVRRNVPWPGLDAQIDDLVDRLLARA
jgi:AcrR family transcriptional regulator